MSDGRLMVAVINNEGWAAYVGQGSGDDVANQGDRVQESEARRAFPEIGMPYRPQ
jgi:hypothetical protein